METSNTRGAGRTLVWLVLAIFTLLWFSNLEYRLLIKPDEGRYAEIPREMVASGDWTTPRLNGLKYFEKPPLQYWATAAAYEVFGEHQWTSRLWNALTGFLGVLLVWYAGMRLFGREAGRYAAVLLGGSLLYAMMGHVNTLDMGVTFFITLGLFGLMFAQQAGVAVGERRNWMLIAWASLGLAVLSKGLMGFVLPGAALFLYSLFQRDFGVWRRMHWGLGLLVFFAVTTPWFYLVMKANPDFYQFFFVHEHWDRFTTKEHGRYQPWYFFIPILLFGMLPWTLLMLDTLVRSWRGGAIVSTEAARSGWRGWFAIKLFSAERFLLIWAVFIFLFFSKSSSKLPAYVLPMFPVLALLMGKQLAIMSGRRLFWLLAPVSLAVIALLVGTQYSNHAAETPAEVALYGEYANWLVVTLSFLLFMLIVALLRLWQGHKFQAVLTLSLSMLAAVILSTSGYNIVARERSAAHIAEKIQPLVKADMPFYSVEMYEQTLPFYLKRTFILVEYKDELEFGIKSQPERWLATLTDFAAAWKKDKEAMAIIPIFFEPQVRGLGLEMKEVFRDHQYYVVTKP